MSGKPFVVIYVKPGAESTRTLLRFIGKHIDMINEKLIVKIVKINKNNLAEAKKRGVRQTPTLIVNGKKYVSLEKIIKLLTPPQTTQASFGSGMASGEDMVEAYHMSILDDGDDEDDEKDLRHQEIQQRMAQLRRQRKSRTEDKPVTRRSRRNRGQKTFDDDNSFIRASRKNRTQETPYVQYNDDGAEFLEQYKLDWANANGRRPIDPKKRVSRRR